MGIIRFLGYFATMTAAYKCQFCSGKFTSVIILAKHNRIHSHTRNITYLCPIQECRRSFKVYSSFRVHVYSHFSSSLKTSSTLHSTELFECSVEHCKEKFSNLKLLCKHLRNHLRGKIKVECPYPSCKYASSVLSTFTAHVSRTHFYSKFNDKNEVNCDTEVDLKHDSDYFKPNPSCEMNESLKPKGINEPSSASSSTCSYNAEEFIKMANMFLLKLKIKHHVPNLVIDDVVKSFYDFNEYNYVYMKNSFMDKFEKLNINVNDANEILKKNLFDEAFDPDFGALRTPHARNEYIKKTLKFVPPKELMFGRNDEGTMMKAHYVPLKKSLQALFSNESVRRQFNISRPKNVGTNIYKDFCDGAVSKQLDFLHSGNYIKIILYQDAFENCNVLGSARKTHKINGIYYTLANFQPQHRSKVEPYQLLMLIKDSVLKCVEPAKVFAPFISEMKELFNDGYNLGFEANIKGSLLCILGDNLGSHYIGGFNESFSSNYFCRFCLLTRQEFLSGNNNAVLRTCQNYDEACDVIEEAGSAFQGIKMCSVMNKIPGFHVCKPGLPPCLAHDVFEGIVRYDLFRIIKYLCEVVEWIHIGDLNIAIKSFKYKSSEALDKPPYINLKSDKLIGHSVQNKNLLNNLSLIMFNHIVDENDVMWQNYLLLKCIVSYICSPCINIDQTYYLEYLVEKYTQAVADCEYLNKRPKLHYLWHYGDLIRKFGPLQRSNTLRMEQNHQFFKRTIVRGGNYKNVTKSAAYKHQQLQAYILESPLFVDDNFDKAFKLNPMLCENSLINKIKKLGIDINKSLAAEQCIIKCIKYCEDDFIIVSHLTGIVYFGKLKLVLVFEEKYFFVCSIFEGLYVNSHDLYKILSKNNIEVIPYDNISDPFPLQAYKIESNFYISLKFCLLDEMADLSCSSPNVVSVEEILKSSLPTCNDDQLKQYLHICTEVMGAEELEDLKLITQAQFENHGIKLCHAIKLRNYVLSFGDQSKNLTTELNFSGTEISAVSTPKRLRDNGAWAMNFQIPWLKMPAYIKIKLETNKKVTETEKLEIIRIICNEMKGSCPYASMTSVDMVCKSIVEKYPETFIERNYNGEVNGSGYGKLKLQIYNRMRNEAKKLYGSMKDESRSVTEIDPENFEKMEEIMELLKKRNQEQDVELDTGTLLKQCFPLIKKQIKNNNVVKLSENRPHLFCGTENIQNLFEDITGKIFQIDPLMPKHVIDSIREIKKYRTTEVQECVANLENNVNISQSLVPYKTALYPILISTFKDEQTEVFHIQNVSY